MGKKRKAQKAQNGLANGKVDLYELIGALGKKEHLHPLAEVPSDPGSPIVTGDDQAVKPPIVAGAKRKRDDNGQAFSGRHADATGPSGEGITITPAEVHDHFPAPKNMLSSTAAPHKKAKINGEKSANKKGKKDPLAQKAAALKAEREALPVGHSKDVILEEILQSPAVIIVGETGSGKTTQIPQFLHEAGLSKNGIIAITQPRRVAAISIAKRVSEELGTKLGDKVGYSIRFEDTTSPSTRIKFMTDGMLLREFLSDNLLSKYSVIMLDEAHERTLRTDILFGMIKGVMKKRPELKVVIMSATLNAEAFSAYFDNATIVHVEGRQFPVRIFHAVERQEDYLDSALISILQIHLEEPPGDILVFLTGQEEIESLQKLILDSARSLPPTALNLIVSQMFAALPTQQQAKVFDPAPPGSRKVILSTNVAETSITIKGVRYVVDTGMVKVRGFNNRVGIESLSVQPISKASARQRTGRAGREAPGRCYRLYREEDFTKLPEDTPPEILRVNLSSVILLLKASGVDDVLGFDYIDRPERAAFIRALEQLYALGALDDKGVLSPLGRQMAEFPLDPPYSKVLIQSKKYKCTQEAIAIVAMLSVDPIFFSPHEKREEASAAKKKFVSYDGDHITLLNVLKGYTSVQGDKDWCVENFVSARSMKNVMDIREQLVTFCERQDIDPNVSCGTDYEPLLKCILSGLFMNAALAQPDRTYRTVVGNQTVFIHPTSTLFMKKPAAVFYSELVMTSKQYMRNLSIIQPSWLVEVAPNYYGKSGA
ncbi:putative ATP-dependent RNA helicase dhx33 [Rhizophlyctis rosea]|nr:putative ATP-dependent RNA helicase dhx33 [Rhizophlyctis rosea]